MIIRISVVIFCFQLSSMVIGGSFVPLQGYVDAEQALPSYAEYYKHNAKNKGQVVYALWYDSISARNPIDGIRSQIAVQNSGALDSLHNLSEMDWKRYKNEFRKVMMDGMQIDRKNMQLEDNACVTFGKEYESQLFDGDDYIAVAKTMDMDYSARGSSRSVKTSVVTGIANVDRRMYTITIMNREPCRDSPDEAKLLFLRCVKHMADSCQSSKAALDEHAVHELNYGKHDLRWMSSGNEKAKGLEVQIDIPNVMRKSKTFQPHTLDCYSTNINSRGVCIQVFFAVHPMPKAVETIIRANKDDSKINLDKADIANIFPVPPGFSIVSTALVRCSGVSAIETVVQGGVKQDGRYISQCQKSFIFPATNGRSFHIVFNAFCMATAQCSMTMHEMELISPMCRRILNSVTFLNPSQFNTGDSESQRFGTAWFVTSNLLVTCSHVVGNSEKIFFKTPKGERVDCSVIVNEEYADLAILKTNKHFPRWLSIGKDVHLADEIYTLGYPNPEIMGKSVKYTSGVVSSTTGLHGDENICQVTAPMQPGNSGGPILNAAGEVVAVASSRLEAATMKAITGREVQNVNFAIKGSALKEVLEKCHCDGRLKAVQFNSFTNHTQMIQSAVDAVVLLEVE